MKMRTKNRFQPIFHTQDSELFTRDRKRSGIGLRRAKDWIANSDWSQGAKEIFFLSGCGTSTMLYSKLLQTNKLIVSSRRREPMVSLKKASRFFREIPLLLRVLREPSGSNNRPPEGSRAGRVALSIRQPSRHKTRTSRLASPPGTRP
ncbi:hypothetical protein MPNT_320022 [Candidatus Methylacidithermus pantelleriae]|uniref:Uncharacterized protein n=1 Tax=Candidatus Methylacidithermus pantelleriae TaxID=2744239 RepID=A0A8J2BKE8_9BACT|nr:hypothetical protein MPNT_320022 [Candidatus Methylacidithermus pantelleriae]